MAILFRRVDVPGCGADRIRGVLFDVDKNAPSLCIDQRIGIELRGLSGFPGVAEACANEPQLHGEQQKLRYADEKETVGETGELLGGGGQLGFVVAMLLFVVAFSVGLLGGYDLHRERLLVGAALILSNGRWDGLGIAEWPLLRLRR
jgi:hypothetical protein